MTGTAPSELRVTANGLAHHVIEWNGGDRGDVVLCHGFLDLAWSFEDVATRLAAAGHRVVAFDWRGHGETEWIGRGGYYHFPDYVLDLAELLPQIASPKPHLVGHSMGGTACAFYAGTRPGTLRSLSLLEGIGPPEHPPALAPDRVGAWLRTVAELRAKPPRKLASIDEALERMLTQNPFLTGTRGRALAERATRPADDGEGWVFRFDPLHRTTAPVPFALAGFLAFLARIDCPTLVVGGTKGFRVEGEADRVAAIPASRMVELDGVGHMLHWDAPDRVADALLSHFAAISS